MRPDNEDRTCCKEKAHGKSEDADDLAHSDNKMPIDTGFAWIICASSFFISFLMAMYDHTLAVVFPDLITKYEVTMSVAALVFTINNLWFGIGSVLSSSFAVPRANERVVVVVSTTINAVSTIIISFSPNIIFFHAMHVIKGLCLGAMWVPALGLLEHYFRKHRSFATALSLSGIAFSMLVSPPIVRLLYDTYGLTGTYLLIGAVELHGTAAAMLLRPVQSYCRRSNAKDCPAQDCLLSAPGTRDTSVTPEATMSIHELVLKDVSEPKEDGEGGENLDKLDGKGSKYQVNTSASGDQNPEEDTETEQFKQLLSKSDDVSDGGDSHLSKGGSFQGCHRERLEFRLENTPGQDEMDIRFERQDTAQGDGEVDRDCPCCCYFNCCVRYKNSDGRVDHNRQHQDGAPPNVFLRCFRVVTSSVDTKLLTNWLVPLLLLSTVHGALMHYTLAYLPTLAISRGLDKSSAALLLTVAGAVNFFGMLLQGLIVDTRRIKPSQFVALAQIVLGTMYHVTRFLTSFPSLVLLSVTQGLLGGSRISLLPVVAVEFVDVSSAGKIVGFNSLIATLSLAAHHPLLGYVKDVTGNFNLSFHYVGFGLYFSSALFLLSPVVRRLYQRRMLLNST
ncbi:monocarboxylate transporter 5 [Plakobranchus ocellatus]|uniref:Monocarboxylate transporter 5 n=1 Tax=Plakobranchus ocellatus TaxID=259542 RepID=A0AAV3Y4Y6_9GAST|nr:monocarboxylate transporter 5 [Plakobranchus ocellatus]